MFSIEHDEQFQVLSFPPQEQTIPQSRLIITKMPTADTSNPKCSRKRKPSIAFGDNIHDNVEYGKRIIHRDVERQRRQQMASLYRSLRSLVPDEYLQGKRSISDLMHVTVEYVRHLNNKVDEMMNKRNQLQQLMKLGCSFSNLSKFSLSDNKTSVTTQRSTTGMQLIMKTTVSGGLPLSKFVSVLNGEGLAVISCISTKVNAGQLHVMEFEVDEGMSVDQTKLQRRLRDLVYNL